MVHFHSQLGRAEVRRFCKDHHIAKEDAQLIEFLVSEHLTMSHIAQKQDLSDPDVIQSFAKRVGNERNLTALYLLTVADIRGTSPKVWNAWKGKLLEDLYRYTLRALGGRAPDPDAEVEARKREALTLLALYALPFEAHKADTGMTSGGGPRRKRRARASSPSGRPIASASANDASINEAVLARAGAIAAKTGFE